MSKKNIYVFMDISIDGGPAEKLIFELFFDIVPKTAENFRALCTGENGIGRSTSKPLSYKESVFHRIVKGFVAQGGDFTRQDGSGGESIYGGKFPDENFKLKHVERGFLSMANRGKDTNGSQFFITFKATPHLDGKHVVFGKVVQGIHLLKKIEQAGSESGKPVCLVKIVDCGEIPDKKAAISIPIEKGKKHAKSDSSDGTREIHKQASQKKRRRKRRDSSLDSYSTNDSDSDSYSTSSASISDSSSSGSTSSSDYRRKRRRKVSKKERQRTGKSRKEKHREKQWKKKSRRNSKRSPVSSSCSSSENDDYSSNDSDNEKSVNADITKRAKLKSPGHISHEDTQLQENGKSTRFSPYKKSGESPKKLDTIHQIPVREPGMRGAVVASHPASTRVEKLTEDTSRGGAHQRIRKGRGFTKEYSFARKYRTPSPSRSPDRPYYHRGERNDGGRFGRVRNYRERSPPRRFPRSPSMNYRYRGPRRRSRSNSPRYHRPSRGRERNQSPRRRSPNPHLASRRTSPPQRARSRSPSPRFAASKSPDGKRSRLSSPSGHQGLVSYGDGEP